MLESTSDPKRGWPEIHGLYSQVLTWSSRPSSPLDTTSRIRRMGGSNILECPCTYRTPLRSTASTMACACSRVTAIGFSQITCLPCSAAMIACSEWCMLGVHTQTASTFGLSHMASTLLKVSTPYFALAASNGSGRMSATAVSFAPSIKSTLPRIIRETLPRPASPTLRTGSMASSSARRGRSTLKRAPPRAELASPDTVAAFAAR